MAPTWKTLVRTTAVLLMGGSGAWAEPLQSVGQGEGEVDIVAWPGYVERGESDKNYD